MLIKWLKIRAKGVLCFSQGFGNRFPAANRWNKRAKLILADDLSLLSMQDFRQER